MQGEPEHKTDQQHIEDEWKPDGSFDEEAYIRKLLPAEHSEAKEDTDRNKAEPKNLPK